MHMHMSYEMNIFGNWLINVC